MDRQITSDTTHVVQRLRSALEPGFPYGASLIPLDILIAVTAAHRNGSRLTIRQLIDSLPYSVTGVRYNLNQLVADGWLEKSRAKHDRRTVMLQPTEKVEAAFEEIVSGAFDDQRR
jgi:DNA-binding MarR family transcriptional regulator